MVDSVQGDKVSATNIKEIIESLKLQKSSANILCKPKYSSQVNILITREDSRSNINSELKYKCSTKEEQDIKRQKLSVNETITKSNFNIEQTRDQNTTNCTILDILKTLKAKKGISNINCQDNNAITTITTRESNQNKVLQNDIHEQKKIKNHEENSYKRLKLSCNQGNQSYLSNFCNDANVEPYKNRNSLIKHLKVNSETHGKKDSKLSITREKSKTLQNKFENKTTFDDFCTDVIKTILSKSDPTENLHKTNNTEVKINTPQISNKENMFPKYSSTGYMDENKINNKSELNSLPITDFEIKSRRERLKKKKVNFDDFVHNIVKEINGTNANNSHLIQEKNPLQSLKNQSSHLGSCLKLNVGQEIQNCEESKDTNIQSKSRKIENNIFRDNVENFNFLKNCDGMTETVSSDVGNITVSKDADVEYESKSIVDNEQIGKRESKDFVYFPKHFIISNPSIRCKTEHNDIIYRKSEIDVLTVKDQNFTNTIDSSEQKKECYLDQKCTETEFLENSLNIHSSSLLKEDVLESVLPADPQFKFREDDSNCGMVIETEEFSVNSVNSEVLSGELLEDGIVNFVLPDHGQDSRNNEVGNVSQSLNDFLENLKKQNEQNISKIKCTESVQKKKCHIRRYKKGNLKIYKIKNLKKPKLKTNMEELEEENLNFNDIFKKITQNVVETECNSPLSKSMSSISTPSSYVTDLTKSEILSTGSNELTSPQQRLRKGMNELSKDKSLLCLEKEWEESENDSKDELKMKIQEICLKVGEDFLEKKQSSLKYRRQSFSNCIFKDGRLQLRPLGESSMTVVKSTALRSQTKFKLILCIMKKIQTLLETNTKLTKRELYYQLKTLVNDQRVIDRIINSISSLLNVGMWTLNIIAQKGLVFGNLKILLTSGETLNCNIPGTLIPQDVNEMVEIHSTAYFILVVEKESIFYKLIEEGLPGRLTRPFIMITGKGFPDLNTQLFLKRLWMLMSIPVFILVDADPHGVNIMLNYRYGSVNNAHVSHHLAVPNAKWLGVYPSEVVNLNLTKELLSERELKLVDHLLKTPYVKGNARLVAELKVLLEKKYKAEIEGLIKSDTFLSDVYLPNKFFTHNFI